MRKTVANSMKLVAALAWLASSVPTTTAAGDETVYLTDAAEILMHRTADQWLAAVRDRLPRQPTWIKGWLSTDGQAMVNVDMLLDLGHDPPMARYTLRDAFGRDLKEITLWRDPDQPRIRFRKGSPLDDADPPDLFAAINETAMSWGDLSLSFLWWPGGDIVGQDEVRGRDCVILEIAAPEQQAGIYDHVRLWIDVQHRMLLQAEGYDVRGRRLRRMQVRSLRKIGDEWMVKDIVIRRYPGSLRTNLRIRDMGTVGDDSELTNGMTYGKVPRHDGVAM